MNLIELITKYLTILFNIFTVCGVTLLLSVPVLFFGFFSARYSLKWCYGLTFLAGKKYDSYST